MNFLGGGLRRKTWLGLIIVLITVCFLTPGPKGAALANTGSTATAVGASIVGVLGVSAIGYVLWKNRPSQHEEGKDPWEHKGLGDRYVAVFMCAALVPSSSWDFQQGITGGAVKVSNQRYTPGVLGGLKFGYFCDYFPWLGVELETNFTRNDIRDHNVTLSRPVQATNMAYMKGVEFYNWTIMALYLKARYGFFPDKEVPFGRLQPYVGIGPGVVVIFAATDSAKNFSLEAMAGVRYMILKNISAFVEYKFSKQWDVELESQTFNPIGGTLQRGTAHFDFDSHKIAVGVAYHF